MKKLNENLRFSDLSAPDGSSQDRHDSSFDEFGDDLAFGIYKISTAQALQKVELSDVRLWSNILSNLLSRSSNLVKLRLTRVRLVSARGDAFKEFTQTVKDRLTQGGVPRLEIDLVDIRIEHYEGMFTAHHDEIDSLIETGGDCWVDHVCAAFTPINFVMDGYLEIR